MLPLAAAPARAQDASSVDGAVNTLISGIKVAGEVVKQGIQLGGEAAGKAKDAYDAVAPYVKQAADVAAPVVAEGAQQVTNAVVPALKALEPQVKDLGTSTAKVLVATGVDPTVIDSTGKTVEGVVAGSKPLLQQLLTFVTTTPPTLLAEYAVGAVALYYLSPTLLSLLAGSTRGYAGEVSAAAALDQVCSDGNAVIVDIRSQREKEVGGVPDLPVRDRLVDLDYAVIQDKKLRGALRNVGVVEANVTALQVAALKRLSKGTSILLMDKSGAVSKTVAKYLNSKGFRKCYVVAGGYEGRGGWTNSKLPTKLSTNYAAAEVLPPLAFERTQSTANGRRALSASQSSRTTQSSRKALPSGN